MPPLITNLYQVVKGTYEDYKRLKEYHYIISDPCCIRNIYKVRARFPYTKSYPDPIAVIVYAAPIADLEARHKVTNNFFKTFGTNSQRVKQTNNYINYIARIIVDPRFHRQGIASLLLQETLPLQGFPIVETLTPLDHTSRLFSKFNFQEYHIRTPVRYTRIQTALRKVGIYDGIWHQPELVQYRIDSLSRHYHAYIHREIKLFLHKFKAFRYHRPGITRTTYLLSKINYPNAYQVWFDPEQPLNFVSEYHKTNTLSHSGFSQKIAEKPQISSRRTQFFV